MKYVRVLEGLQLQTNLKKLQNLLQRGRKHICRSQEFAMKFINLEATLYYVLLYVFTVENIHQRNK